MDSSSELSDPPSSDPPSSPLSELSKSPSLSPRSRYPTPLSTLPSGSASPMKMSDPIDADSICVNPDGGRPAKRRKIEQRPRTTERLNLHGSHELSEEDDETLDRLLSALRKKQKIVIVAGAGISVSAGIPDFRSSNGLFKTLRTQHKLKASGKQLFDASVYKHDESTESFHDMVRELSQQTKNAKPTAFHHMIASIAEEGRLLRMYTQNVDGIETSMPPLATTVPLNEKGPWPKTIQIHGGLDKMVCTKCGELYPFDGSLFNGPTPPPCKGCTEIDNVRTSHAGKRSHGVGKLRPRMTLYNEHNPDQDAILKVVKADLRARPDAVIVVGTTLKVPGTRMLVKDLCDTTRKRKDGLVVWINLDSEPNDANFKDCWDIVVRGKSDDVASLVALPHWDKSPALGQEVKVDEEEFQQIKQNMRTTELEVRIPRSPELSASSVKNESREATPVEPRSKPVDKLRGIPTPIASPKMRNALPSKLQQKTKQSRILFANSKSVPATASKEGKKPAARKSRQPKSTAPKPLGTIKTTFKATKASVAISAKVPAKRTADPIESLSLDTKSILRSDFSLRPLAATRQKADSFPSNDSPKQTEIDSQLRQDISEGPTTPTQRDQSGQPRPETISPPSKPRGLSALID